KDAVERWKDRMLAVFLVGGTVGGIAFGSLADRIGRKPTMALTILFYSVFSGLTYFATELWEVAVLRFLVALGVGGEWAVAAALVAEVFPNTARAHASGIFHATSVLGTWLAALAGLAVGAEWRYAYVVGQAAGGGLGLLAFGPLAERLGRRRAFALMHVLAAAAVPVAWFVPWTYDQLLFVLPVYGFLTLSIHAGYAVYFPELFPDH